MKNRFIDILKGKVVIVGVGNSLRGDDGAGPALIQRLKDVKGIVCMDAGSAPENYTGKIIRENPDTIIIVDTISAERQAGEYEILQKEDILKSGFTTHDISPNMFIEYIEGQTHADIYLLGIQPKSVAFGEGLSDEVSKTLEVISDKIKEALDA